MNNFTTEAVAHLRKCQNAIAAGIRGAAGDAAHQAAKPFLDRLARHQEDLASFQRTTTSQADGFEFQAGQLKEMPKEPPGFVATLETSMAFWRDNDPWNDSTAWLAADAENRLAFRNYGAQSQMLAGALPGESPAPVNAFANLEIYNPKRSPGGGDHRDPPRMAGGGHEPGRIPHPRGTRPAEHAAVPESRPSAPGNRVPEPEAPESGKDRTDPEGGHEHGSTARPGELNTASSNQHGIGGLWEPRSPGVQYSGNASTAEPTPGVPGGTTWRLGGEQVPGERPGGRSGRSPASGPRSGSGTSGERAISRTAREQVGGRAREGTNGAPPPGQNTKKDEEERKGPRFLVTEEHGNEIVGELPPTAPPVIGE
ncbi:hypothetical protein [Sciscionella sediminilitoris]|uniref:hypothetical protein n=1 Tax=Sciscionella sediminilitoris TaxID=1445613 RepID=UPI0004DECD74|nr:hypothetical protein [Sciscionella sp. SE31]